MKRSEHRILTTHVGSLVRPPDLLSASRVAKELPAAKASYLSTLKKSVAAVVKQQADSGIDIVNDGEFGKMSWANYILGRLSGFDIRTDQIRPTAWVGRERERFKEFFQAEMPHAINGAPTEACVGPIAYTDHDSIRRDTENLTAA